MITLPVNIKELYMPSGALNPPALLQTNTSPTILQNEVLKAPQMLCISSVSNAKGVTECTEVAMHLSGSHQLGVSK